MKKDSLFNAKESKDKNSIIKNLQKENIFYNEFSEACKELKINIKNNKQKHTLDDLIKEL